MFYFIFQVRNYLHVLCKYNPYVNNIIYVKGIGKYFYADLFICCTKLNTKTILIYIIGTISSCCSCMYVKYSVEYVNSVMRLVLIAQIYINPKKIIILCLYSQRLVPENMKFSLVITRFIVINDTRSSIVAGVHILLTNWIVFRLKASN